MGKIPSCPVISLVPEKASNYLMQRIDVWIKRLLLVAHGHIVNDSSLEQTRKRIKIKTIERGVTRYPLHLGMNKAVTNGLL